HALEMGADAEDLAPTIHPHPTLAETVGVAAEMATGTMTDPTATPAEPPRGAAVLARQRRRHRELLGRQHVVRPGDPGRILGQRDRSVVKAGVWRRHA